MREQNKGKYLIVNADDFGLCKEVNEGIIKGFKDGIITSASLLVNQDGFEDALIEIKQNRNLDIGLHLNIFRGKPLRNSSFVVNKNRNFFENEAVFLFKYYANNQKFKKEVYSEFEEQIKKALSCKIKISHLDTEKHLHILPGIFEIIISLAKKYDIKFVRFPFERLYADYNVDFFQSTKLRFSSVFFEKDRKMLIKSGLRGADHFFGISLSKNYSIENFCVFLKNLPEGINELSCHPGLVLNKRNGYIDDYRENELQVLTNKEIRKVIKEENIILINFSSLNKNGKKKGI